MKLPRHEIPPREDDDDPDEDETQDEEEDDWENDDLDVGGEGHDPMMLELAHNGIDLTLDAFAKTGPDKEAFHRLAEHHEEPTSYWRYKTERSGVVGYTPLQNLTKEELLRIREQLILEGEELMRQGRALQEWVRKNKPQRKM